MPTTRRHSSSLSSTARVGMRDARIVDQDGDGAERLLRFVEGAHHRVAVEHVGLDRQRAAAGGLDARLHVGEPVGAARHQRDRGAVLGQHLGEAHAEPARRAGDQRDAAGEIEQIGCGAHRSPMSKPPSSTSGPVALPDKPQAWPRCHCP